MDVLRELRKEQDEQCARMGDKWQDYDRLFINAGVDVVAVSGDLGHSQVSTTTNIYCHMFQEAQARTSQAIADALIFDKKEKQGGEKAEFPA